MVYVKSGIPQIWTMESGIASKEFRYMPSEKMWKLLFSAISEQDIKFFYMSAGQLFSSLSPFMSYSLYL